MTTKHKCKTYSVFCFYQLTEISSLGTVSGLSLSKPSRGEEARSFARSKSSEAERERLKSLERNERVCVGYHDIYTHQY